MQLDATLTSSLKNKRKEKSNYGDDGEIDDESRAIAWGGVSGNDSEANESYTTRILTIKYFIQSGILKFYALNF